MIITSWPLCPQEKDPVSVVKEAGGALEPVWEGAENLVPTEIRSTYRSTSSKSLYSLLYKSSLITYSIGNILVITMGHKCKIFSLSYFCVRYVIVLHCGNIVWVVSV